MCLRSMWDTPLTFSSVCHEEDFFPLSLSLIIRSNWIRFPFQVVVVLINWTASTEEGDHYKKHTLNHIFVSGVIDPSDVKGE